MEIAHYWPGLASVFAAAFVAFLSPGPNFVGIVSTTVTSRANGLAVAVGCSLGTTFWSLMAATGLSALLALNPSLGAYLQIVGGGYLLWLAWKSFRGAWRPSAGPSLAAGGKAETLWAAFRKGLLIQMTNPKTALFWLSIVSVVIGPGTPILVSAILVAGTTLIALFWHCVLALVFSHPVVVEGYVARRRWIALAFATAFVALGGSLVVSAISRLAAM